MYLKSTCHFREYKELNLLGWVKTENEWLKLVQSTDVCTTAKPLHVLLPWCLGMPHAKQLCDKFRGQLAIVDGSDMQKDLFVKLKGVSDAEGCLADNKIWTGFSDEEDEGHFVDLNNKQLLNELLEPVPFFPTQPNGGEEENCAMAWNRHPYEESWYDTYCARLLASFCKIDHSPRVQVRGEVFHHD